MAEETQEKPDTSVARYRAAKNPAGYETKTFASDKDVPKNEGWLDTPASFVDEAHPDFGKKPK